MSHNKEKHHVAIRGRAARALLNLYHNATPHYPRNVPDQYQEIFQSWFEDTAMFEIEYIANGGASTVTEHEYRKTLEHSANAGRYSSEAARRYYVRKGLRAWKLERARCNSLDSREHATSAMWEQITQYGKLYSYGRGGRTLAPSDLINSRGSSSFGIKEDYADELPIGDVIELIQIVESFNRYVEEWCSRENIEFMWKEYFGEILLEKRRKRKAERREAKKARAIRKAYKLSSFQPAI